MLKYQEQFMYGGGQKLLVFEEKHGTWYFVANDATEISMALLTVLQQRLNDDWYLDGHDDDDLTKTDKDKVQAIVDMARSDMENAVIEAGAKAYDFLNKHSDYEYERFTVEYPMSATFDLTPA